MTDQPVPISAARAVITNAQYQTTITIGRHSLIADEPEELQGSDTGPSPNDLLLASLSSCTAITLQMYINRKKWIVESITVDLQMFTADTGTLIKSQVSIAGDITDEQKKRLQHIADVCPVHKILVGSVVIETMVN